jgi:hypothetical protein
MSMSLSGTGDTVPSDMGRSAQARTLLHLKQSGLFKAANFSVFKEDPPISTVSLG